MPSANRVTNVLLVIVTLTGLAIVGMLAHGGMAGPLDPPGPPASTDGVRGPGTPISSLPFATTEGGYFYVTRNLSAAAGQAGITICCSNTTIDLGGYTLTGAGAGNNPGDGVSNPGARNIVVRNGAVRNWATGINLGGSYSRVEHVRAISNTVFGITVGGGSEVTDCIASLNGSAGIIVDYATVRDCSAGENGSTGILGQSHSLITGNHVISHPNSNGIAVLGSFNTISSNDVSGSGFNDIQIGSNTFSNVVRDNVYCDYGGLGANTYESGNINRPDAC